jgi:hypothetical protein
MSSSNPNDPNDPGNASHPAPSSATGMFSAPEAPPQPGEPAVDDFFAQFREPTPPPVAVQAPPPAQVPAAAPVHPPAFVAPQTPSGGSIPAFVNTPLAPQAFETQKPAVRSQTPQLREVFIKSSTGKVRTSPPPEPVVAQPPPAPASVQMPGDFTRIFRASEIPSSATPSAPPSMPPAVAAASPEIKPGDAVQDKASFSQLLRAITDQKPAPPAPAAQATMPPPVKVESITQILERLDRPRSAASPTPPVQPVATPHDASVPPVASSPVAPEIKKEDAGSFTQFMSGITPAQQTSVESTPLVQTPPPQASTAAAGAPGSFTQIMASLGSAPAPAKPAESLQPQVTTNAQPSNPGSMTQLLQSLDKPRTAGAATEALQSSQPPSAAPSSAPQSVSGGFTQFFQNPMATPQREAVQSPFDTAKPSQSESSMKGGSFTQLMQALDQPKAGTPPSDPALRGLMSQDSPSAPAFSTSSQGDSPFSDQGLSAANAGLAGPGGFTRLMQTLDGPSTTPPPSPVVKGGSSGIPGSATNIFAVPSNPVPQSAAPSGPSEFTQILSGSALRDARAQAPAIPPGPPPAPIVPGAMQMPGFSMPQMQMPQAPQPTPMAMPQMQMPGMPMPQLQPPQVSAPPAAPQKSKLQKYLPLILIGNVLLIIVIVVIVFFVLHGHK